LETLLIERSRSLLNKKVPNETKRTTIEPAFAITQQSTKLARVRVLEKVVDKGLVELERSGELLHDLEERVDEQNEVRDLLLALAGCVRVGFLPSTRS